MIDEASLRREILELKQGLTYLAGSVSLTASVTSTAVTRRGVSANSVISLTPYTSAARTEGIPQCVPAKDSFVLTHVNTTTTRTYMYVVHTPQ